MVKSPNEDSNKKLDEPINHLESKKEFLEVVHDSLVVAKKVEAVRKTGLIEKTKEELKQFDTAIEILKEYHSDDDDK